MLILLLIINMTCIYFYEVVTILLSEQRLWLGQPIFPAATQMFKGRGEPGDAVEQVF